MDIRRILTISLLVCDFLHHLIFLAFLELGDIATLTNVWWYITCIRLSMAHQMGVVSSAVRCPCLKCTKRWMTINANKRRNMYN